ncbi:hypothetical protein CCY99_06865 [Helicobacter sp. 16-1353]|uniref:thiamine phosphate synthase n=1 Tax=Helicobacter sp. 16-1353 TaxID=2004996 RepID=UPI000DCF4151|nr:thiamine phosphate synthase [Helicobacter sp. 16-1353]RAX52688.1 hypothetical protein CCY99_06865 [Helicobacter sp. 16-1353]
MSNNIDKFLITNPSFYTNIDRNIAYAMESGVSKIYLRDIGLSENLLIDFLESCKKYNILLFINYIVKFLSYNINGIHLKGGELHLVDKIPANLFISYSAHSLDDVINAYNSNVDFIFLSPILFVKGKMPPLGIEYINKIPDIYKHKIYALGGINSTNIEDFYNLGIKGVAGIRMFLKDSNV